MCKVIYIQIISNSMLLSTQQIFYFGYVDCCTKNFFLLFRQQLIKKKCFKIWLKNSSASYSKSSFFEMIKSLSRLCLLEEDT